MALSFAREAELRFDSSLPSGQSLSDPVCVCSFVMAASAASVLSLESLTWKR